MIPWMLIFTAMRLAGFRQRAFFAVYAFGTILFIILAIFWRSGRSSIIDIDFFMFPYSVVILWAVAILFHVIVRLKLRSRKMVPVSTSA
jgi:hypothetical protein